MENIEDLLFCDRLVGGLWVGFRCRSEDGVNVDINEGKQLGVQWGGGFTELPIDPVLQEHPNSKHSSFLNYMVGRYKIHQEFSSCKLTSLENLLSIQN